MERVKTGGSSPIGRRRTGRRLLTCLGLCLSTLLAAAGLWAEEGTGPSSDGGFRQAVAGYAFHFPRDHGSHDEFRTEWWYYTGHLTTADGRRFGYQLTFFRRGIDSNEVRSNPSRWAVRHLYLAHVALSYPCGSIPLCGESQPSRDRKGRRRDGPIACVDRSVDRRHSSFPAGRSPSAGLGLGLFNRSVPDPRETPGRAR